jgi:pimeloyl-ACP methyl ester carboxylesterase
MISYQAPNPYPNKSWFGSFFAFFSSSSSSTSIGKLILPAQWRAPKVLTQHYVERLEALNSIDVDGGFIQTHDNTYLDTIQLMPTSESSTAPDEKYYIVKFNGNGGQYQDLVQQYAEESAELKATIIGFNYRGVGNSKKTPPNTFQELVTDGIAQVQRLLDDGADPKKITLDGISLGGAVATMVASHFHNRNLRVSLWNDRSLATLSKAAAGMIAPALPGLLGDACFESSATTSYSVMKLTGWDVDVATAYNAIPAEYKAYMVVAEKSQLSTGDGVIAHKASLHSGVSANESNQHINTGHIVYSDSVYGGHNVSRRDLVSENASSITGQRLYENFVQRNRLLAMRNRHASTVHCV